MINKKILLGKVPEELGKKDACHVAIVSVRAGSPMEPGTKCSMNKDGEAICDNKGIGVADPFLKKTILRGQNFLLILNPDVVDNVSHIWDHPKFDFSPPTTPIKRNSTLDEAAKEYGVTYEQMIAGMTFVLQHDKPSPHPGNKTQDELDEINDNQDVWDLWSNYSDEVLYEFDNIGSECCPEYQYPDGPIFEVYKELA